MSPEDVSAAPAIVNASAPPSSIAAHIAPAADKASASQS
jgi:hypothetical protein